jgi:ribulose-5-phosphate 4-epimerase/fuculose-1-phosphate aldolase
MNESQLRESIAQFGKSLFDRGLTCGSTGNISVKLPDGILITPTNSSLGYLDPARLTKLDSSGRVVSGDPPSKEAFVHLSMYTGRPSSSAVLHLHSTYSVAVSCLADLNPDNALPPITAYYQMRVGKLALVPFFVPGDLALAKAIGALADRYRAILLANHGPVVAGDSLEASVYAIEELEETAKLFLLLKGHKTKFLTSEQVAEVDRKFPR